MGSQGVEASVLLSEGCWFDSPCLRVEVSLGQETAPDALIGKSLLTKVSAKCRICKKNSC